MNIEVKLRNILRLPEIIPNDKRIHYMIGVLVTTISLLVTANILIAGIAILVVSYCIEYYQKWAKSGQFGNYDALSVILGGVLVILALIRFIKVSK